VCFFLEKCPVCSSLGAERLLKALWWMKTYPTEQELHNKRVSAAYFRAQLWQLLKAMNTQLPEVRNVSVVIEKGFLFSSHRPRLCSYHFIFGMNSMLVEQSCVRLFLIQQQLRHTNQQWLMVTLTFLGSNIGTTTNAFLEPK
jgi:hypothetical protein